MMNGNIVNTLPVFYTGVPRTDTAISEAQKELSKLNERL